MFWSLVETYSTNLRHNSKDYTIPGMYLVNVLEVKSYNCLTLKQAQWHHDEFCRQCRYTALGIGNDIKCLHFELQLNNRNRRYHINSFTDFSGLKSLLFCVLLSRHSPTF